MVNYNDLHPWMYPVTINNKKVIPGIGSSHSSKKLVDRALFHKELFVNRIKRVYNFKDKIVLDVGSNCGYFSLEYAKLGSLFTDLIDGRDLSIKQGELLWTSNGYTNFKFHQENVMSEWNLVTNADFTICAGILYHVKNWEILLDKIFKVTNDCILIETAISKKDRVIKETAGYFNAITETSRKRVPTYDKLIEYSEKFGKIQIISKPQIPNGFVAERVCILVQK